MVVQKPAIPDDDVRNLNLYHLQIQISYVPAG